jgi:hypothetical protein
VAQARQTIGQEIADNRSDLDSTLAGMADDAQRLENAMTFARDLLTKRRTTITELKLHVNLADLSSTAWHAAERTGALGHMSYAEVQRYSGCDLQDLMDNAPCWRGWERLRRSSAAVNPDNPNIRISRPFANGSWSCGRCSASTADGQPARRTLRRSPAPLTTPATQARRGGDPQDLDSAVREAVGSTMAAS